MPAIGRTAAPRPAPRFGVLRFISSAAAACGGGRDGGPAAAPARAARGAICARCRMSRRDPCGGVPSQAGSCMRPSVTIVAGMTAPVLQVAPSDPRRDGGDTPLTALQGVGVYDFHRSAARRHEPSRQPAARPMRRAAARAT